MAGSGIDGVMVGSTVTTGVGVFVGVAGLSKGVAASGVRLAILILGAAVNVGRRSGVLLGSTRRVALSSRVAVGEGVRMTAVLLPRRSVEPSVSVESLPHATVRTTRVAITIANVIGLKLDKLLFRMRSLVSRNRAVLILI